MKNGTRSDGSMKSMAGCVGGLGKGNGEGRMGVGGGGRGGGEPWAKEPWVHGEWAAGQGA